MAQELVEVIYGKHSKYEIIKDTGSGWSLSKAKFVVKKDGKHYKTYSTLSEAVEGAKKAG